MTRFLPAIFFAVAAFTLPIFAQSLEDQGRRELTNQRTPYSQVFQEADGSLTLEGSSGMNAYLDGDQWRDIDPTVVALESEEWSLGNLTNSLQTRFDGKRAHVSVTGPSSSLTYTVNSLAYAAGGRRDVIATPGGVGAVADGAQVTYPSLLNGVDAVYSVYGGGIQQKFVFAQAPRAPQGMQPEFITIRETLVLSSGAVLLDVKGNLITDDTVVDANLQIRSPGGSDSLWIQQPLAFDAIAALPVMGKFRIEFAANGDVVLETLIPYDWFSAENREYPVVIDPDLNLQPDGAIGKDSQLVLPLTSSNYGSSERILQNWSSGSPTESDGMVEYDLSPIPMGSLVNTATVTVRQRSGTELDPMGIHTNDGMWDENVVTWSNSPTFAVTPTSTVPCCTPGGTDWVFDVVPDVQDMIDGTITNFGWRISMQGMPDNNWAIDVNSSDEPTPMTRPKIMINYDIGGVDVRTIDTPDTTVVAGLGGYMLSATIENAGPNILNITAFNLSFTGTADRTGEYVVTPDIGNPSTIPAMGIVTLNFLVDVDLSATQETITIDGSVATTDAVNGTVFLDMDADTTDMWDVIGCLATFCGDCNGDMMLSILDALIAAQHSATLITLTGQDFTNCNVIGTLEPFMGAEVNILDALTLAQSAAGLPVTLTCC